MGFRGFPEICSGPGLRAPPGGVPVWGRTRATVSRLPSRTDYMVACRLYAPSPFRRPRPRRVALGPGCPDARLQFFLGDGLPVFNHAVTRARAHARLPQGGPSRSPTNPPNPGRGFRSGQSWAAPSPARSGPRFDHGFNLPDARQPAIQAQQAKRIPAESIGPLACPGRERLPLDVNQFQRGP